MTAQLVELELPSYEVTWPTLFVAHDWAERHCVVGDGFRRGQPMRFYGWQSWSLLNFYRVRPETTWLPDAPILGPAFHWRRSQLVLPQKAGKAPYSAAHICVEAVGPALFAGWATGGEQWRCADHLCPCGWVYTYEPGEAMGMPWPTPLVQVMAYSQDQTDNIWRQLKPMIELGPLSQVIPRVGEDSIKLPNGGEVANVTSSADSRLGNPTTYAAQDETGLYTKQNKMVETAKRQRQGVAGMSGRVEETTNAWNPALDSTAQQTFDSLRPDIFRFMPQAPDELRFHVKHERHQIYRAVYLESLRERGGHVDPESLDGEALEFLERDPLRAERFYGNRPKSGGADWLPAGFWWSRRAESVHVRDGDPISLGFDGSDTDDWTALRACTMHGHLFTPTYGEGAGRPTIWNPSEHGGSVPRLEVHAAVAEVFRRFRVVRMLCDPPDWETDIEEWVQLYGERRVWMWRTNRIIQMHEALQRFETDLRLRISHDGCRITRTHVNNARKFYTSGDRRYYLVKASRSQKIDAAMASVLAYEGKCEAVAARVDRPPPRRRAVVHRR